MQCALRKAISAGQELFCDYAAGGDLSFFVDADWESHKAVLMAKKSAKTSVSSVGRPMKVESSLVKDKQRRQRLARQGRLQLEPSVARSAMQGK